MVHINAVNRVLLGHQGDISQAAGQPYMNIKIYQYYFNSTIQYISSIQTEALRVFLR